MITSYSSRFPVVKGSDGKVHLKPHSGNLAAYDDFVVDPFVSPTNIACDAQEVPPVEVERREDCVSQ